MTGNELLELLKREIGLDIDAEGYITDQDMVGVKLGHNGKLFRINKTSKYMKLKNDEVFFSPLSNMNIMKSLFDYYLSKLEAMGEKSFVINFLEPTPQGNKLIVRDYEGKLTESNIYMNVILCYCDLILRIGGNEVDLRALDNKEFKIE